MTRRSLLLAPLFSLTNLSAANNFWTRKPASQWSEAEIQQLITKSPWAQDVRVDPKSDVVLSPPDARNPVPQSGERPATMLVCWYSAKPIVDGLGHFLPSGFEPYYGIGVRDRNYQIDPSTAAATLAAKGKESVQAGVVKRAGDVETVLFGFPRDLLPLTATDRDVVFALDTKRIALQARFEPKEMIYQGQLAV
jgi:hypothetical protein